MRHTSSLLTPNKLDTGMVADISFARRSVGSVKVKDHGALIKYVFWPLHILPQAAVPLTNRKELIFVGRALGFRILFKVVDRTYRAKYVEKHTESNHRHVQVYEDSYDGCSRDEKHIEVSHHRSTCWVCRVRHGALSKFHQVKPQRLPVKDVVTHFDQHAGENGFRNRRDQILREDHFTQDENADHHSRNSRHGSFIEDQHRSDRRLSTWDTPENGDRCIGCALRGELLVLSRFLVGSESVFLTILSCFWSSKIDRFRFFCIFSALVFRITFFK